MKIIIRETDLEKDGRKLNFQKIVTKYIRLNKRYSFEIKMLHNHKNKQSDT